MTELEREQTYKKSISVYGSDAQIDLAIEEMSELIKALLKFRRYGWSENAADYLENVIEEIADVKIMSRQLEMIFNCKLGVEMWIDKKVKRQQERMKSL